MAMALRRILIKTHHMTSRKKIGIITRAAKRLDCSVLLKVGANPGIMLCEGQENHASEWETVVRVSSWICFQHVGQDELQDVLNRLVALVPREKANINSQKLRYKDMRLLKRESISEPHLATLGVKEGDVKEIEEVKDFAKLLEKDPRLFHSWRVGMGYVKDDGE
ncbi:hypothetical protein LHYA1_G009055 [Lachnellula hyalina]|uniref:Uncharacterized protein n=1 Tax=Lachnellula hyalina TaxID=1316788 RepID=A0A8H8TTX1_9HELO|nr:uncharacterized protein LHYA1_G009055 [Lachnellula hyalina]TVY22224.1 hypothetical protein LHYA1_G009055 [Lachnellula hyalina]